MVEEAVTHVLQLLKDDSSRLLDVNHILECLEKANKKEIAEKVFTDVAKCIQTQKGYFECIHNLVSIAANVFNLPCLGGVPDAIRLICNVFAFFSETKDAFSVMSVNKRSELSEKLNVIDEKLHAFCSCFDARSSDLKVFNEEKEKKKGRVERLLDDNNYKEIGMDFSGELQAIILRYKNVRGEKNLKSVGEMLTVYVRVAIMRRMMQISLLSIASDEEMENAIKRMKMYMENDAKRRIDFLTRILEPSHENAIFLSFFSIRESPLLNMFLKTKGFIGEEQPHLKPHMFLKTDGFIGEEQPHLQPHMFLKTEGFIGEEQPHLQEIKAFLINKRIALQPVVYEGHWMNSAYKGFVWSTSTEPHDNHAQFHFEVVSEEENIFFITSSNRNTYIYMKSNSFLSQTSTRPNKEGMFKVLRLKNGNCLISVVKYPGSFIHMQNTSFGRIKGSVTDDEYAEGLPSEQHEWSLNEVCHFRNRFLFLFHILEPPLIIDAFSAPGSGWNILVTDFFLHFPFVFKILKWILKKKLDH